MTSPSLLQMVFEALAQFFLRLDLILIVGVVLYIVYGQYKRAAFVELRMFGFIKNHPGDQLKSALVYGFLGGLFVTAVFIGLGVSLAQVGIMYLWMMAILLMLIHPRFICFAYGAGILALSNIILGVPDIDVPALMAVVAILHLAEAILIRVVGADGASPVYVRRPDGKVVGGFMLQKFWPIPFVALIGAIVTPEMIGSAQGVNMPDWWPIFKPTTVVPPGMEYAFGLFPIIAALGYSDVALSREPVAKAEKTAKHLFWYSIGLLVLAFLAQYGTAFAVMAALFSPLAHEWVILSGQRSELGNKPMYDGRETMILDVQPGSPADLAGLRSGDVIVAVNGYPVFTREQLADTMQPWLIDGVFTVERYEEAKDVGMTNLSQIEVVVKGKTPPLGAVFVPNGSDGIAVDMSMDTLIMRLWRQLTARSS